MGHYTHINKRKAESILHLYQRFSPVKELSPLVLGISNSNYKVTTQDQVLLLKVSNDKDMDQLKKEQEILLFLQKVDFPYSLAPIPLANGELVYHLPPFYGVVFPFVSGKAPIITPDSCQAIGRGLATLHLISQQYELPPSLRPATEVGYDAFRIREYAEKASSCPQDFRQLFTQIFPDHLTSYLQQDLPKGLIHGDLYYDNTLFQGPQLLTMLDFEQAGIGDLILDLGISLSGTCLHDGSLNPLLLESYLQGYQDVRPLTPVESAHLREAILLGLFSIALWRIKRFREGSLDPQKADSYRELLHRAWDFHLQNPVNQNDR